MLLGLSLAASRLTAQVPAILAYQGRLSVSGTNFTGAGQFKFALVGNGGAPVFWGNAPDAQADGQPDASVTLSVSGGFFSVTNRAAGWPRG
jgi:hypothetical protein